jgi:outer membrane lipoprotein SlyB
MHKPIPVVSRTHPMLIIASIAVVLFCTAGTAAILGWLPASIGGNPAAQRPLGEEDRALLAVQAQPAPPPAPALADTGGPAAPAQQAAPKPAPKPAQGWCAHCGNVEAIREVSVRGEGTGLGAAGGAILGGLLGNQVGGGTGKKVATVAGAVGGAVVGNQVEGNMKATKRYEIRVRLDDGTARTFHQQAAPRWQRGDRVKIVNGGLRSMH